MCFHHFGAKISDFLDFALFFLSFVHLLASLLKTMPPLHPCPLPKLQERGLQTAWMPGPSHF